MATPASAFRPNGPARTAAVAVEPAEAVAAPIGIIEAPPAHLHPDAVELDRQVPPGCQIALAPGGQSFAVAGWLAGRTVRIWADLRSIHVNLDGRLIRSLASRLRPEDLRWLTMRGAQPAGPPAADAYQTPQQGRQSAG